MEQTIKHTVYLITNRADGSKKYIGKTRYPLPVRWGQHVHRAVRGDRPSAISDALGTFGWRNFTVEEIGLFDSDAEASDCEARNIDLYGTLFPAGYNKTTGGTHPSFCSDTKAKNEKVLEKVRSEITLETRAAIGRASANRSPETIQKLSVAARRVAKEKGWKVKE